MSEILTAFATSIFRFHTDLDNAVLDAACESIRDMEQADRNASDEARLHFYDLHGYTSFYTNPRLHLDPSFHTVSNAALHGVHKTARLLDVATEPGHWSIRTAFANRLTSAYHGQGRHIHPGAVFSGVLYIRVDPDTPGGGIHFYDPAIDMHMFQLNYNRLTPLNTHELTYRPTAGELLIFRSYVPHEVEMLGKDSERIAVSFNFGLDVSHD